MHYPNGDKIKVGDELELWEGNRGIVVASIEEGVYSEGYDEGWSYLKKGILIAPEEAGLIHYIAPEWSFRLIKRSPKDRPA